MQRIKNDVLSWIQKIDLSFFTDLQYQYFVENNYHSTQIQVKTTEKSKNILPKITERKCLNSSSAEYPRLRKALYLKLGAQYDFRDKF